MTMKRLTNICLAFLISPEILVFLLIIAWVVYSPKSISLLGSNLKSDTEIWKYMPTLTLLFAGSAFTLSSKIRAPLENSSNRSLYEWPMYPLLVDRVYVSLVFAVVCGISGLLLWVLGQSFSPKLIGTIFCVATSVAATTALTMLLAFQKLRELIDRYGTDNGNGSRY